MRVLHVLAYSPPFRGGFVGQLVALGEALRARGGVLCLAFPRQRPWLTELAEVATVLEIRQIWHPHRTNLRRRVLEICGTHNIELINLHYSFDLALSLFRPLSARPLPVVYHWHNPPRALRSDVLPARHPAARVVQAVHRRLGALAAHLGEQVITRHVAVSGEIRDLLIEHGWTTPEKILRLPNPLGIVPPAKTPAPDSQSSSQIVIGSVANFLPQKDHDTLLRAFQLLLRQHTNCRLLLVGDGPRRAAAASLADALGIRERVEFLGHVHDPMTVYPRFDILAHSTHYEGQGMVLLEAMAHGLPVVATKLPSIQETITGENEGLLVPRRDPESLATALAQLVSDASLRARMGAAGRARVLRDFRVGDWVDEMIALYDGILGRPG
ncbi:MAG: glycosyltransferase family 4 protein [Candidatus Eisenbacteria sp.]|nr:glycosyltransferase family 4 protein [Candidatus Eisenbacteria bacterium]